MSATRIGQLIAAYELGRLDRLAYRSRRKTGPDDVGRAYRMGWREARYDQMELPLPRATRGRPPVAQSTRARMRDALTRNVSDA